MVLLRSVLAGICGAMLLAASANAAIETSAKQAYMIDATTQAVLLDKGGNEAMAPSSMSKLMTIYALFQRLKEGRVKLTDTFLVSEKAWRTQGSKMFVGLGDQITVEDLINGIIVQSGNDACVVVAENLSGTEEAFAENLNRIASEIGLKHSHFKNSTGLPEEGHVMSPHDLAILAQRLIQDFPEYYHYFAVPEFTYHNIHQPNRNRLLTRGIGVDGLKTGHAEEAGYGITLSAKQGERRLVLVINGLESDKARAEEGEKLLLYGLREFQNKKIVSKDQKIDEAQVWFGEKQAVALTSAQDIWITLPGNTPKDISFALEYQGPLQAPVAKGAAVAELVVSVPGQEAQRFELVAAEDVAKNSGFVSIWSLLRYYTLGQP